MAVAALVEGGCSKRTEESIWNNQSQSEVETIEAKDDISVSRWDNLDANGSKWYYVIIIWWGHLKSEAKNETCRAECLRKLRGCLGP